VGIGGYWWVLVGIGGLPKSHYFLVTTQDNFTAIKWKSTTQSDAFNAKFIKRFSDIWTPICIKR
jgi:hypothetical protein